MQLNPKRRVGGWLPFVLLAGFATAAWPADAGERCEPMPEQATYFGVYYSESIRLAAGGTAQITSTGARYIRAHFQVQNDAPDDWALRVYDDKGRPLQSFDRSTASGGDFWTDRLPSASLSLKVESASNETKPILIVSEYVAMPQMSGVTYYSKKTDNPDWKFLYSLSEVPNYQRPAGLAVGMLFADYDVGTRVGWTCTGFVVATRPIILFATADHCGAPLSLPGLRWHPSILPRIFVDFSWDGDLVSREYVVAGKAVSDAKADLAVLPLRPLGNDVPPQPLPLSAASTQVSSELYTIHHPASDRKMVSMCVPQGLIQREGLPIVLHDCDVESGSSGAPMLDGSGKVVAIHIEGHEKGPDGKCDKINKAAAAETLNNLLRAASTGAKQ
jgi:Trypsin-like peptidase domain